VFCAYLYQYIKSINVDNEARNTLTKLWSKSNVIEKTEQKCIHRCFIFSLIHMENLSYDQKEVENILDESQKERSDL
jgi:hypothetical protein